MKAIGLDGRHYSFPPQGYAPPLNDKKQRSEPHLRARSWIKGIYPTMRLLEEVPIPGSSMRLDFYIPQIKTAFEVQGRQHYEFVEHFHKTISGFRASQQRDNTKREWCDDNNITLICLRDDESEEEWYDRAVE